MRRSSGSGALQAQCCATLQVLPSKVVTIASLAPHMGLKPASAKTPTPALCATPTHRCLAPGLLVLQENCLTTLQRLPDGCVELLVVDPPFGFYAAERGRKHGGWDRRWSDDFWKRLVQQILRVLSRRGRFIVFCLRDLSDHLGRLIREDVYDTDLTFQRLLWQHDEKTNTQNTHMLMQDFEEMLVYSRKADQPSLRLSSDLRNAQFSTFKHSRDAVDDAGRRKTMKPQALMEALIATFTRDGDLVVDVTANNHVTGRAAHVLERRYVGVELDPRRYREGIQMVGAFLEGCPQSFVQLHLAEDAAHRLHDAICAGVRAAERNNDHPGAPRLVLRLQGRRYSFYGFGTFDAVRAREHVPLSQEKVAILLYRGEAGLLTTLRQELAGFEALCSLAEANCPGLVIVYAHVLLQSDAQACLDWHRDTETRGYRHVKKTLVVLISDTRSTMDIVDEDGSVKTLTYRDRGSAVQFDAGCEHRSGKASPGTVKVALMLARPEDARRRGSGTTSGARDCPVTVTKPTRTGREYDGPVQDGPAHDATVHDAAAHDAAARDTAARDTAAHDGTEMASAKVPRARPRRWFSPGTGVTCATACAHIPRTPDTSRPPARRPVPRQRHTRTHTHARACTQPVLLRTMKRTLRSSASLGVPRTRTRTHAYASTRTRRTHAYTTHATHARDARGVTTYKRKTMCVLRRSKLA